MSNTKKVFYIINLATFLMFIALPNLLIGANDTVDVSIIFSVAEEENKECQKDLDSVVKVYITPLFTYYSYQIKSIHSDIFSENYLVPILSKSAPPPRF